MERRTEATAMYSEFLNDPNGLKSLKSASFSSAFVITCFALHTYKILHLSCTAGTFPNSVTMVLIRTLSGPTRLEAPLLFILNLLILICGSTRENWEIY